jgi:hypothetical protein
MRILHQRTGAVCGVAAPLVSRASPFREEVGVEATRKERTIAVVVATLRLFETVLAVFVMALLLLAGALLSLVGLVIRR